MSTLFFAAILSSIISCLLGLWLGYRIGYDTAARVIWPPREPGRNDRWNPTIDEYLDGRPRR